MEVDFSGNYTNELNCAEGDIVVVVSEGFNETKKNMKNEDYEQFNMEVENKGKKLIHSPKTGEGRDLVKAWGSDTKKWIGKQAKVTLITYEYNGQRKKRVELIPSVE